MLILSKKITERHYFERVRSLLNDFPDGVVEACEEPDFLVRGARVVGIEITELHRLPDGQPIPPQGRQADRERVVQRAKAIYDNKGLPVIDCLVQMKDVSLHARDFEPLAQAIATLAERNMPAMGEWKVGYPTWTAERSFPDQVDRIRVARFEYMKENFFGTSGTTWVVPLSPEDVQRALIAKEKKHAAYLTKCDEAWLIIVIDATSLSTWFDGVQQLYGATFRTPFTRVLVLSNAGEGKVFELATT